MLIGKPLLLSLGVLAITALAAGLGFSVTGNAVDGQLTASPPASPLTNPLPNPLQVVTVYKTPSCGCCTKWVDHLEQSGLNVESVMVEETHSIRSQFGVPHELASCHTAIAGDYWVEGHVPADLVQQLLRDQPDDIRGIAVPGMPAGSPGGRPKTRAWPAVGRARPSSILTVVVLPAPLGPRKPNTSPGATARVNPSTATVSL